MRLAEDIQLCVHVNGFGSDDVGVLLVRCCSVMRCNQ